MGYLTADQIRNINGVTVNEFLLTKHNPNGIDMPSKNFEKIIGVTIHNTDWITVSSNTTPAEQYSRATYNGNMGDVRVHFYVDNVCAWQNLPLTLRGWHAADGDGDGNAKTIAIECIMSPNYNQNDQKSEDNAAKLAAGLLKQYGFGIDQLYTHSHWYSKKNCPAYILPHWEQFRRKVQSYLGSVPESTQAANKELYRIRKTWNDVSSQIGAYSTLEAAKSIWKEGYIIYNNSGAQVWPEKTAKAEREDVSQLRVLSRGSKGKDVESLQAILEVKGYSCGSYHIDGDFGAATETAVMNFQKDNNMSCTGIVDAKIWKTIIEK